MTIIVFLVDTSASMNQRTYLGTTLLDVAKGAVETFMKVGRLKPLVQASKTRFIVIVLYRVKSLFFIEFILELVGLCALLFRFGHEIQTVGGTDTCF